MNSPYPLIAHNAQQQPTIRLYSAQTGVKWPCLQELIYIEAQHNYTWLHWADTSTVLVPYTIKRFAEKLPLSGFGRVHRKFVVNYDFVMRWDLRSKAGSVSLSTGIDLPVSRQYRSFFKQKIVSESSSLPALTPTAPALDLLVLSRP